LVLIAAVVVVVGGFEETGWTVVVVVGVAVGFDGDPGRMPPDVVVVVVVVTVAVVVGAVLGFDGDPGRIPPDVVWVVGGYVVTTALVGFEEGFELVGGVSETGCFTGGGEASATVSVPLVDSTGGGVGGGVGGSTAATWPIGPE
jgi:hypothetical protein